MVFIESLYGDGQAGSLSYVLEKRARLCGGRVKSEISVVASVSFQNLEELLGAGSACFQPLEILNFTE